MDDKYQKLRERISKIIEDESSVCIPLTSDVGAVALMMMRGMTDLQMKVVLAAILSSLLDSEEDVQDAGAMLAIFYSMKGSNSPNN